MNEPLSRRTLFIIVSAIDVILSGAVLLIYFDVLPVDISAWNIPRWLLGLIGGVWFAAAIAVLAYYLTRTDVE